MRGPIVWWTIAVGCWSAPPAVSLSPRHGAGLDAWVEAAVRGEALGPEPDAPEDDRVAAALAFARIAEDAEERIDAVVGLAAACGACHDGRTAPPAPPLTHAGGAWWAIDGLVWRRPASPASDDPRLEDAIAAWFAPVAPEEDPDRARATRWLGACLGCHTTRTPRSP